MTFAPIILPFRRETLCAAVVLASFVCASCSPSPTTPGPSPTALILTCPAALDAPSPGGAPVPVTFSTPIATGGAAPLAVTCSPASGATFATGATPVACTATDASSRQATCGFTVNVIAKPVLAHTRFLVFGDSLTEGKLSLSLSLLIDSPAHSYPAKLLALLHNEYPTQSITVINEGLAGERAVDSGARFEAALSRHQPQSVLLMHGVNDLNSENPLRVQAAAEAVEDHIKQARSRGMTVFVASLPPLGPPKGSCPECVVPLNDKLQGIAAVRGAVFVDVYRAWGNQSGLMGADGIHPTEAGYEVIAKTFFEAIRSRLQAAGQ